VRNTLEKEDIDDRIKPGQIDDDHSGKNNCAPQRAVTELAVQNTINAEL
jgi:hypothetical protein